MTVTQRTDVAERFARATRLRATRKRLEFHVDDDTSRTVDILLNGSRVWSTHAAPDEWGWVRLHWPLALRPHLHGRTILVIRDSSTKEELATAHGRFGADTRPLSVTDAQGNPLAIDKWSRLSRTFENPNTLRRDGVLDSAERLAAHLAELGVTAYVCSGTLLGAVRDGHVLPHDDDVDFGFLAKATHPSDILLEGYALEAALGRLGYRTFRHSGAHLQVLFDGGERREAFYIDIFTGFFREDGTFNQPFHLREPMPRASIAPTSTVELEGRTFVAPGSPDAWLRACYGPSWGVPDPSFKFRTPTSTRHRFDSWFGVMDGGSEKAQLSASNHRAATKTVTAMDRMLPPGAPVVFMASAGAALGSALRGAGRRVIITSPGRDGRIDTRDVAGAAFATLNLSERRRTLEFGAGLVRDASPWNLCVVREFERLTPEAQTNVLLLARLTLDPDGRLLLNAAHGPVNEILRHAAEFDLHLTRSTVTRSARSSARAILMLARGEGGVR